MFKRNEYVKSNMSKSCKRPPIMPFAAFDWLPVLSARRLACSDIDATLANLLTLPESRRRLFPGSPTQICLRYFDRVRIVAGAWAKIRP